MTMNSRITLLLILTLLTGPTVSQADENNVITLRNTNWDHGVLLEIKRGKSQACVDNPNYGGQQTVYKGQQVDIPCAGQEVCWRRKVLGYADEAWTDWTRDSCFDSETHDL
jgi:hypothetical protein